jgi:hypothetical protein
VPEWLIGADCKSAALRATQVRILPPPPLFYISSPRQVVIKIGIIKPMPT